MELNMAEFEKMFACIAFGLQSKLRAEDQEHYKTGLLFRQGVNLYSLLALRYYSKEEMLDEYLNSINESKMIRVNCTNPVKEWFVGWNHEVVERLEKLAFYHLGALIICSEKRNSYQLTGECEDYLNASEKDLSSIDEHIVFSEMKDLSQEYYVDMRRFLIEHPITSTLDKKEFLIAHENDDKCGKIIGYAYEPIPSDVYLCPNCGWTLSLISQQPRCCHHDCATKFFTLREKLKPLEMKYEYRLKKGVMKYISYPGRAELEIKSFCDNLALKNELWPEHDLYDIKITFSDGTSWGIDAKTYGNPYLLSQSIKTDFRFQSVRSERRFYVIPDSIVESKKDYLKICNDALDNRSVKCISMGAFYKKLKKEIGKYVRN